VIEKIALITFGVYWVLVEVLKKKGVLERYSITSYGPILMIRTQKGMEALERLSRPKSFWRGFSSVGLVFMLFAMTLMLFLVFLMDYRVITSPPEPSPLTAPRNVLLLPGVNQFIPLWYGLIGLVITLIAHEFSHGVLCRVEGIKVRALGLLVALVPIGGFAEPDEEELNSAEKWKKIRVFTAGIMSNFLVALIFFAIFFSSLSFLAPVSSSEIVVYDAPQDLGIRGNMFLEEINGKRVMNIEELIEVLSEVKGGEEVNVKLVDREGEIEISTLLSSEGAKIMRVWDGTPAEKAGLKDGDVIISMNGERINNFADFYTFMKGSSPGEEVRIKLSDGREVVTVLEKHPKKDIGFLGVSVEMSVGPLKISTFSPSSLLKTLKSLPFSLNSLEGWFTLISLPFLAIGGFTSILTSYFLPSGIFSSHEILFFFILNSSFWIAWINFYAGLFNSLPAVPLDGGHVFKELLSSLFNSLGISNAKDLSSKFSSLITLYIFASFLLAILIPHISQWF
jgi:membrane-associated protease RseP (regulator of RpoE activity)